MNNSITSLADTFMPPRAEPLQSKSNPAPTRQSHDYTRDEDHRNEKPLRSERPERPDRPNRPASPRRPDRPERSHQTNHNTSSDDQVNADNNGKKRDFNEVLAKKMAKNEAPTEKNTETKQDSESQAVDSPQIKIPITEVALPESINKNKIIPLVNITKTNIPEHTETKKTEQTETQKTQEVDVLIKNPAEGGEGLTAKLKSDVISPENTTTQPGPVAAQTDKIVTPTDAIPEPAKEPAKEDGKETDIKSNAIPIKTLENKPQQTKITPQDIQQTKNTTDQTTQKAQTETLASTAETTKSEQPEEPKQTEQTNKIDKIDINPQAAKTELKPVAEQLETMPQSSLKSKFEKSLENSKAQALSQTNTAAPAEIDAPVNKNATVIPASAAAKDISNAFTEKTPGESDTQAPTQIPSDTGIKTSAASTVKVDSRPVAANSVVNQVTEHIRASMTKGRENMSIALDPPELGRVMIKFQQRNGEIVGIVEAEKAKTHREIAEEMPQIVKSLNDSGIAVKKIEVILTEENSRDTLNDNSANGNNNTGRDSFQDSSDNQQNQSSDSPGRNYSRPYNPKKNADIYTNNVSDDAINMFA